MKQTLYLAFALVLIAPFQVLQADGNKGHSTESVVKSEAPPCREEKGAFKGAKYLEHLYSEVGQKYHHPDAKAKDWVKVRTDPKTPFSIQYFDQNDMNMTKVSVSSDGSEISEAVPSQSSYFKVVIGKSESQKFSTKDNDGYTSLTVSGPRIEINKKTSLPEDIVTVSKRKHFDRLKKGTLGWVFIGAVSDGQITNSTIELPEVSKLPNKNYSLSSLKRNHFLSKSFENVAMRSALNNCKVFRGDADPFLRAGQAVKVFEVVEVDGKAYAAVTVND